MACRECAADDQLTDWDDVEGCIDGTVYGFCSSDDCYGLCDDLGRCDCECHRD